MNNRLLPNRILPPAGFPHPEPSWFDYSKRAWIAINKLSTNNLLIEHIPGAALPEVTPNQEPIDPQPPDPTCTPDWTETQAYRQVVSV